MSLTITSDAIDGNVFTITANGPSATKIYKVVTSASENMADILGDAGIPQVYDAYSDTGGTGEFLSIYVLEVTCEPIAGQPNVFMVTVQYGRPDATEKEPGVTAADSLQQVGSSVSSGKTQKDNTDTQLAVALTGQTTQVGEVDIQIPETVVVFERKEATSPLANAIAYTGKVNSVALASGTYAVRTLLCLGIEGTSVDDGDTWQVTYRFQYRPDTWDATLVYIDPETDRPHEDINLGTSDGVLVAEIYPEANFASLDLNW
jgi:hypothetical protein